MEIVKRGFTFLELIVVLLLFGLIGTIVIPAFRHQMPGYKRNDFIVMLNALSRLAWQQALEKQKTHRVYFDIEKRLLKVEIETDKKDSTGVFKFADTNVPYLRTSYEWNEVLVIKEFFIEGKEMMKRPGIKTQQIWFYISPEGISQEVIINLVDTSDLDSQQNPIQRGLIINPFTVQFKEYDTFQKP